jgi:putative glutamine amidotransferase
VLIPNLGEGEALWAVLEMLDGLLLPGGADMAPATYGAEPHVNAGEPDPALDETELALARWALGEETPVLGICRGQQCLNVAAGGTLFQDVPTEVPNAVSHRVEPRDAVAHAIAVEPDSRLADLLGGTEVPVNSLHHQAVRDVAPGFIASAWAPDGVIEGIESLDHGFAVAVQFHPEELVPGHQASEHLLRRFVAEATGRPRRRTYTLS